MLDETLAQQLMRDRLLSVSTAAALESAGRIAWQNRQFTPPDPTGSNMWIRELQSVVDSSLNTSATLEAQGLTTYQIYCVAGTGTETVQALSLEIRNAFRPGQWLREVESVPVDCPIHVWKSRPEAGFTDSESQAWYVLPVVINWRAHPANTATP